MTGTSRRRSAAAKPPVFFAVLVVLAVVKAWLMRGFALGAWNPLEAVAFESAFVVLFLGLADVIPPRRWYWLDLAAYSLLSLLLFAMTMYVKFYSQLFDPHMLAMAGQLGTVTDAVGQLVRPVYGVFLIDIPLLAVWIVRLRGQAVKQRELLDRSSELGHTRQPRRLFQPLRRSLSVALLTLAAFIAVAGQLATALVVPTYVDGVAIARSRGLSIAQVAALVPRASSDSDDSSDPDVVAPGERLASVPQTSSALPVAPLSPAGKVEAKIERIRGSLEGSRMTTFAAGAFRGKNVIIVQVEALNTMVMRKTVDGKAITPNLNRLIDESWYFPNTYSETGMGNTADAEFIVNSSLFAPRTQAAPVAYADREIPALPRLMKSIGYDTFTMHTNRIAYWNRKELYAALGFDRYYERGFFHRQDPMGMGASDETLFRGAMTVVGSEEASKTPFYAQIITLSAHTPFEAVPESRRPLKTPARYRGSMMGEYISAESYGDLAIGEFIDALKQAKVWDDSIVIFYGDHTAMFDNQLDGADAKAARALLGRDYGPVDRQRIPLVIHLPGQTTPVKNADTVGQVDIMPTVADLVGLDLTQVPHMGRSVFVRANAFVPLNSYLPGGSFLNDRVLFMPGLGFDDGVAVNIVDGTPAARNRRLQNDYKRMLALTRISNKWALSLPKRKDAGSLGVIPNPVAAKAAGVR